MNILEVYILNDDVKGKVLSRIRSCAKIKPIEYKVDGRDTDSFEMVVDRLFHYFGLFNSINEYDTMILGRDLGDIDIPEELVAFITPKSVKYSASDIRCHELMYYTDRSNYTDCTLMEWNDLIIKFKSIFKKEYVKGLVKLGSLKKCVSLSEIFSSSCFIDERYSLVRYMDKPFIPVLIKGWVSQLYRTDMYFNSSLETVIDDYLTDLTF